MTIYFEQLSDKSLSDSKLIKKLHAVMREYNRRRQRLQDTVTEQKIAALFKLLSHFDLLLSCVSQQYANNPEVAKLRFRYQPQISQEWFQLFHLYLTYTSDPEYSIDELLFFARKANQSYLPRVLVESDSPIANRCQRLHQLINQLAEIKKQRRKNETAKIILEELALREALSEELQVLLMDPELYSKHEKELFRTLNQQALVIAKLINKFPQQTHREYQTRFRHESLVANCVNQLVNYRDSDELQMQASNFITVSNQLFKDCSVTALNDYGQTVKLTHTSPAGLTSVTLQFIKLSTELSENDYSSRYFDAFDHVRAAGLGHLLAQSYAQILMQESQHHRYFVEIAQAYPYNLMTYLERLRKHRQAEDEYLTLLLYTKKIIESLQQLNQIGVYYLEITPKNLMIDQWGSVYLSSFKSMAFLRDWQHEHAPALEQYQLVSLGLCLFQLAHHYKQPVCIEDLNLTVQPLAGEHGEKLQSVIERLCYPGQHKTSFDEIQQDIASIMSQAMAFRFQARGAINDGLYTDDAQQHLHVARPEQPVDQSRKKAGKKP